MNLAGRLEIAESPAKPVISPVSSEKPLFLLDRQNP
jgi:hypothetical protein